ncbi:TldD/PmbA family protein [Fluviispira sanaruensis]|uniref:TldD/PmbA family protein n=1 Tax=Fluviispira sanaruensis TaxID=2493639 RepID=A0A4V0P260_FLUSA|nr:TldD/PmbA family protein [Fluviispira sanaruensis]BBH52097.1 TldD/PmbA family protein [Fluviispira sanaruensis]
MSLQIEQLVKETKKIASDLNIEKFDIFGTEKEESSASAKDKKPFSLTSSIRSSLILRVWNQNQQMGVTRTSNLTTEGLSEAFDLAKSSAEFGSRENIYEFSPECHTKTMINHEKKELKELTPIQELMHGAISAEEKILNASLDFKSVPYNKVSEAKSSRFYFNSEGAIKIEENQISFCYFYPLAHEKDRKPRQSGHLELASSFANLDILTCAEKAIKKTKDHLNYTSIQNGKYPVVFSPEAFLDLVNAFANFMNAQNILDKKSLCHQDSIGQALAANDFCLVDSPLHPLNMSKSYFDEEGTPTRELTIIENGVLKNFIHSSFTAKKMGYAVTGHANIGAKVTVSPHFLYIKSSNKNIEKKDYLNENNLIYVESVSALHAGVNELQGSFSLPFDGFYINDKQKVSIEAATVAGDFLSLLKDIYYIGDEEFAVPNGISPIVWVKSLSITGL